MSTWAIHHCPSLFSLSIIGISSGYRLEVQPKVLDLLLFCISLCSLPLIFFFLFFSSPTYFLQMFLSFLSLPTSLPTADMPLNGLSSDYRRGILVMSSPLFHPQSHWTALLATVCWMCTFSTISVMCLKSLSVFIQQSIKQNLYWGKPPVCILYLLIYFPYLLLHSEIS